MCIYTAMHSYLMISRIVILGLTLTLSSAIVIDPDAENVTDAPTNCEAYCTNKRGTPYCCRYLDEDGNEQSLTEDEKPGHCRAGKKCPEGKRNIHYCEVDIDCPGALKCCSDRCGSLPVCKKPSNKGQTSGVVAESSNQSPHTPSFEGTHTEIDHFPTLGEPAHPAFAGSNSHSPYTGIHSSSTQNGDQGLLGQIFQGLNNGGINTGFRPGQQGRPNGGHNQGQGILLSTSGQTQLEDGTVYRPLLSFSAQQNGNVPQGGQNAFSNPARPGFHHWRPVFYYY